MMIMVTQYTYTAIRSNFTIYVLTWIIIIIIILCQRYFIIIIIIIKVLIKVTLNKVI